MGRASGMKRTRRIERKEAANGGLRSAERREFCWKCLRGGLGATIFGSLLSLPGDSRPQGYGLGVLQYDGPWAFLEKRDETKMRRRLRSRDPGYIRSSAVPLGPPSILEYGTEEWSRLFDAIVEVGPAAQKSGLVGDPRQYKMWTEEQRYGLPDDPRYSRAVADYSGIAINTLYENIKTAGEVCRKIDWVVLKEGDDFGNDWHGKGFVGYGFFMVQDGGVVHKDYIKDGKITDSSKKIKLAGMIGSDRGGFNWIRYSEGKEINELPWNLFVSTSPSLGMVFSEAMPLLTSPVSIDYEEMVGNDAAALADETVVEAEARLLTEKVSEKHGRELRTLIPDLDGYTERKLKGMEALGKQSMLYIPKGMDWEAPVPEELRGGYMSYQNHPEEMEAVSRYGYVRKAMGWMKRYGMQPGFDLYMGEGPGKFMNTVLSS